MKVSYFSLWFSAAQMRRHLRRGPRDKGRRVIPIDTLRHDHRPVEMAAPKVSLWRRLLRPFMGKRP